jgi:hypothetical protein
VSQPGPVQSATSRDDARPSAVDADSAQRPVLVPLAIGLVAVLFVTMVSIIYYKSWLAGPTVSALLVVQGDESMDGDSVGIEGTAGSLATSQTLQKVNNYIGHFPLPAGTYHMWVEHQGSMRSYANVKIGDYQYVIVSLVSTDRSAAAATQP